MSSRLTWYLNRLKTMNLPEIFYRAGQFKQRLYEKAFPKTPHYNSANINTPGIHCDYLFFKDRISDTFSIFGKNLIIDDKIDFHKDIFSGKKFPAAFSKSINTRSDEYGSAKVVWEINRLQFLLPIIIKYRYSGDAKFLDLFVSVMTAWDIQNPYMKGVNWYSNIEVNIRLINWYWCWILLEDDANWQREEKYASFRNKIWLPLVYKHCYYSYHNPSLYSSSNNHLISEYAGLFVANTLWKFEESGYWLKKSKEGLEKEILRQYSENGINKEEAAEYIQFITDFFLLAYISGQHHSIYFSNKYKQRLIAIAEYINNFLDVRHNFPKYGDEDDGKVIIPDGLNHENNFISILNSMAVLFDKPEFKRENTVWDVKSHLLTSHMKGLPIWNNYPYHKTPHGSFFYEKEGHLIFRNKPGEGQEIYGHFDAAPLGYLSIAAHGHADALSFLLNVDGYPFLADPGTFTYHTHKEWRSYFVGTLAHNTVTINNSDQAVLAGPTLWVDHYTSTVTKTHKSAGKDLAAATHNGYQKQGFEHVRQIEFDKTENKFTITDVIAAKRKEPCQISIPFHLHPGVSVLNMGQNKYQLGRKETNTKVQLIFDAVIATDKIDAKDDIPLGWYSASFMKKEKSSVLMGEYVLNQPEISLTTIIKVIF
jgi:Heparinase II/III-like protein/Heparinase II/III N-terminus